MNNEQLLNDFVDGALAPEDERSFFAELSENEYLRGDLRTLMTIQRGVRHTAFAAVPIRAEGEALFRKLGFAEESSRAAAGWDGAVRLTNVLSGIVVGMLLMLAFTTWRPDTFTRVMQGDAARGGIARRAAAPARNDARGTIGKDAAGGGGSSRPAPPARHVVVVAGNPSPSRRTMVAEHASVPASVRDTVPARALIDEAPVRSAIEPSLPAEPMAPTDGGGAIAIEEKAEDWPMTAQLELRSLESRSFSRVPAPLTEPSTTLLQNTAIGVRLDISPTVSLGFEFGQERFYQKFRATAVTGDIVEHQQNPLMPWFGAIARLNLYRSTGLNPYVQATVGATQVGPMVRAMAGGYYEVLPELRLALGIELSGMGFRESGTWYVSPKYGVTYGLSVSF